MAGRVFRIRHEALWINQPGHKSTCGTEAPVSARNRWIVVAVALVAAVLLAIAVQGARWWAAGDVHVGPGGTQVCFDGGCRSQDLSWIGGSEMWRKAGLATMAGSLITTIALAFLAGSLAAKRTGRLAAGATLTATLTATTGGMLFLVRFPGLPQGLHAEPAYGLVMWAIGVVIAGVCAVFVLRQGQS
jgi:hypothetical protein